MLNEGEKVRVQTGMIHRNPISLLCPLFLTHFSYSMLLPVFPFGGHCSETESSYLPKAWIFYVVVFFAYQLLYNKKGCKGKIH